MNALTLILITIVQWTKYMNITKIKAEAKYTSQILDLIESSDLYTTSDLQGIVTALVMKIARDKDLLTFDERLYNSRDIDLF